MPDNYLPIQSPSIQWDSRMTHDWPIRSLNKSRAVSFPAMMLTQLWLSLVSSIILLNHSLHRGNPLRLNNNFSWDWGPLQVYLGMKNWDCICLIIRQAKWRYETRDWSIWDANDGMHRSCNVGGQKICIKRCKIVLKPFGFLPHMNFELFSFLFSRLNELI